MALAIPFATHRTRVSKFFLQMTVQSTICHAMNFEFLRVNIIFFVCTSGATTDDDK
ncbi:hypothetical protein RMSM_03964 [Rhodopirellula maiorica SM1]|uniref:Uncharacterized protein n=1 Tax=Rhodopirellula maiorica SM1 TaxID=1265738 RepID=M5RYV8_9BACT|nr:hypothetical protein RMSM_03964 [Rhodopirellula maiorica SM1]